MKCLTINTLCGTYGRYQDGGGGSSLCYPTGNLLQYLSTRDDTHFRDGYPDSGVFDAKLTQSNGLRFHKEKHQGIISDIYIKGGDNIRLIAGVVFKDFAGIHGGNCLFATTDPVNLSSQYGFALITNNDSAAEIKLAVQVFDGSGGSNFDSLQFDYAFDKDKYYITDFIWDCLNASSGGVRPTLTVTNVTDGHAPVTITADGDATHAWTGDSTHPLYFGLFEEPGHATNFYNFDGILTHIEVEVNDEPLSYLPTAIGNGGLIYSTRTDNTYHIQNYTEDMWIKQDYKHNNIKGCSIRPQAIFVPANKSVVVVGDIDVKMDDWQIKIPVKLNHTPGSTQTIMNFNIGDDIYQRVAANNKITLDVLDNGAVILTMRSQQSIWFSTGSTVCSLPIGSLTPYWGEVVTFELIADGSILWLTLTTSGGDIQDHSTIHSYTIGITNTMANNTIGSNDQRLFISDPKTIDGIIYSFKYIKHSINQLQYHLNIQNIVILITITDPSIPQLDVLLARFENDETEGIYMIPANEDNIHDVQGGALTHPEIINGHNGCETCVRQPAEAVLIAADTANLWFDGSGTPEDVPYVNLPTNIGNYIIAYKYNDVRWQEAFFYAVPQTDPDVSRIMNCIYEKIFVNVLDDVEHNIIDEVTSSNVVEFK